MRQLDRQTRISEQRMKDLIIATLNSLCRHGYVNSTISTISKESGFSRGLIGHYFASKEDLLTAAHRYYLQNSDDYHRHLAQSCGSDNFAKAYYALAGPFLRPQDYSQIQMHYLSAACIVPEILAFRQELWGKYRSYIARRLEAVALEKGVTIDVRKESLALAQLSSGLGVGLIMDRQYTAEECLVIIRSYLCRVFDEDPEKHPLWPDFDHLNFPTTAPLPARNTQTSV